jgi:tetratricopeptide (TPR) repeat protein
VFSGQSCDCLRIPRPPGRYHSQLPAWTPRLLENLGACYKNGGILFECVRTDVGYICEHNILPGIMNHSHDNFLQRIRYGGLLSNAVILCFFFGIALLVNYHGLNSPMNYDSAGWIEKQRHIFESGSLMDVIGIFPQRPIVMMSFYANFLFTDMTPLYFRLVNIFILACTALLVGLIVEILVSVAYSEESEQQSQARFVGIFTGLLFLVHPLQTTVTLYIWQRSALMACFFYYASLFAYLAARTDRYRDAATTYVVCAVLFVCALLSKENAVTLPFLLLLSDVIFFHERWKPLLKRAAVYFVVTGLCVGFLSFVNRAHGNMTHSPGILSALDRNYAESGLTVAQVVMTQARVLFTYLQEILLPWPSNIQLTNPQIVSKSLFSPPDTIFAVLFAAMIIGASVYLLKKRPLSGFGLVFFLINLLPEGFLVPQYQYFGYRALLPLPGVLLVGADCVLAAVHRVPSARNRAVLNGVISVCTVVVAVGFGVATSMEAELWADPVRYWKDTVAHFPRGEKNVETLAQTQAFHNLGISLQARGRYQEALQAFQEAARLAPQQVRSLAAVGSMYSELGKFPEAEAALRKALDVDPKYVLAYRHLGDLLSRQGKYEEALAQFRTGLALEPYNDDLHDAIARTLYAQGRKDLAIKHLQTALQLNPRSYVAHSNLAAVYLSEGKTADALQHLNSALQLRPDYWRVHENLGVANAMEGDLETAVSHFKEALRLNPHDANTRANLSTALEQLAGTKK